MKRYFYHSFPRTGQLDFGKGLGALSSMLQSGLLLTPEVVQWRPLNESIAQKRVCFTELAPSELAEHAKVFGAFALEFTPESLRELGAMPVFYVPNCENGVKGYEAMGAFLVWTITRVEEVFARLVRLREAGQNLPPDVNGLFFTVNDKPVGPLSELATVNRAINAVTQDLRSVDELRFAMMALQSLFYPTENRQFTEDLGYYRQREWRIIDNFVLKGVWPFRELTAEEQGRIRAMAPFFEKEIPHSKFTPGSRVIENCRMFTELEGTPVIKRVNRIIVPPPALADSEAMVKQSGFGIPVVPTTAVA